MTPAVVATTRPFVLAAASGVLCFLGFAGFGWWPLALFCLVPLWAACEQLSAAPLRRIALVGFVCGFVAYLGGFHWMWRIVDVFLNGNVGLGIALGVADASWFALRFALYAAAYAWLRRHGWPVIVAALPALLVLEWVHPLLFPVYLGHSLAPLALIVQISDVGGPSLLTALLVLINVVVFEIWRWWLGERRRPLTLSFTAIAIVVGMSIYGWVRIAAIEQLAAVAPALHVAIIQGNLGVQEKGDDAAADHRRYLAQTREVLRGRDVDLVLWPETVYTRGIRRPLPLDGGMIRADIDVPLLFGAASVSGESGRNLKYNSALLIGADGVIRDAYDKNVLIPFTEYVPFANELGALGERLVGASEFAPGAEAATLRLGEWRIATPICHEIVQAAHVRRMMLYGEPHLIATLANDSWFGDSQEPWLHLTMARMRAVEHRRYVVRATNSGISAVIDPAGREVVRSGLLTTEHLHATVHKLEIASLYTTWGDWPVWLALLVLAGVIVREVLPLDVRFSGHRVH